MAQDPSVRYKAQMEQRNPNSRTNRRARANERRYGVEQSIPTFTIQHPVLQTAAQQAYMDALAASKDESHDMAQATSNRWSGAGWYGNPKPAPGGNEALGVESDPTQGGAGLDLSAFDTAQGSLEDTNTAAQHEIAKGLVDFLNRVTSNRDQYMQQTAQQGVQAQGDLNAVVQQNKQQGAPILADLKAQGVDPTNVGALIQGDQQALTSQGALDKNFRQQMGSMQEGAFSDARSAGNLVQQGAQAQRENNYAQSLAQIQQGRADARTQYEQQQAAQGATGDGEVTASRDENLGNYLAQWGPHANEVFSGLWDRFGHDPKAILKFARDTETNHPGYWKSVHLPHIFDMLGGIGSAYQDSKQTVARNGNLTQWAGVQVDSGVQPMFQQLLQANPGLRVNGGWRSAEHNAEVNGASHSHHLDGTAVDFGGTPAQMEAAANWARAHGAREVMIHNAGSGMHLHVAW